MNFNDFHFLLAEATTPAAPSGGGGGFGMFIPLILMFVIFYFVLIRPQKKKQEALRKQIEAMKIGDAVITAGGMHGIITNKADTTVTVKVADNVKLKFEKGSIQSVIPKQSGDEPGEKEDAADPTEGKN